MTATSLGIVVPALKDAGEASSAFGQLVIAGASVADFGAVILLSLLFSRDSSSLGAFTAGALISLVDKDEAMTHPRFRLKLEAAGYGIFVPVFFVASGLTFDLHALVKPKTLVVVPLFLVALLAARGLPALLYRTVVGTRMTFVAALLQATSLPFLVAAAQIGMELDLLSSGTGAALIAAGLLSVLIFPLAALRLLSATGASRGTLPTAPALPPA